MEPGILELLLQGEDALPTVLIDGLLGRMSMMSLMKTKLHDEDPVVPVQRPSHECMNRRAQSLACYTRQLDQDPRHWTGKYPLIVAHPAVSVVGPHG